MLSLASDADFHGVVFRALLRRHPSLDLVRIQDVGLRSAPDQDILEWAAAKGRILLTYDRKTMPKFAYDRVRAGLAMPGIFVLRNGTRRIGEMVEDVLLIALCSSMAEWKDRVTFLPL